nr:unnamed protein product [Callosobruchus chinensis]
MGAIPRTILTVWTSVFVFWCNFELVTANSSDSDKGLLQDLGLSILPDVSKINISLAEYTEMMTSYLETVANDLNANAGDDTHPRLITFNVDKKIWWRRKQDTYRLRFSVPPLSQYEVKNAQLRFLAAPQVSGPTTIRVQVNQVLGARRKRYLEEKTLYLFQNLTKWCELDVTSAMQSWIQGDINLGLDLVCLDSNCEVDPLEAAITAVVEKKSSRERRSIMYRPERRTDCQRGRNKEKGKRKCCRQNMKVNFKKLDIPEMNFIMEPKVYEAGYCYGLCPPNYNHATNHSRIQSLMHQMEKSNTSSSRRRVPKACCAPSKLGPLDILLVNKDNPTKLMLEKWDNMVVIECACS